MSGNNKSKLIYPILLILLIAGGVYLFKQYMPNSGEQENIATLEASDEDIEKAPFTNNDSNPAVNLNTGEAGTVTQLPTSDVLGVRGVGNPDAPVQVREYFSLTCNHCADFHKNTFPQLKSKYIDTGKIYFIYEEMPLNGPALYGSMIARCLPEERYSEFVGLLLETQADWAFGGNFKEALQKNAALAGMGEEDFNACFENEELRLAIADNIDKSSQAWKIGSTPSFVFNNGERILRGGQPIEVFDAVYSLLTTEKAATETPANVTPLSDGITSAVQEVEDFEPNGEVFRPKLMTE